MATPLAPQVFAAGLEEAKRAHLSSDFARARQMYERLLAHNPGEPGPQVLLAELDIRDGRLMSAKKRLERVVAAHPESRETRTALASVLEDLGDVNATTTLYREDVANNPDAVEAWGKLANALQIAGKIDEAAKTYRTMIERWPQSAVGYLGLASIDASLLSADQIEQVERFTREGTLDARVHAFFALGNVREKQSRFDDAFAAFSEGNRLRRENPNLYGPPPEGTPDLPAGPAAFTSIEQAERLHDNFVRETMAMFQPSYFAKFAGKGDPSSAPIFIVGMPRSGSTLLEQILSSHPDVQGLGETTALTRTFRSELAAMQRNPAAADPATFYRRMGGAYLEALRELGWDGKRRVVDKMLANYINVGIIHLSLPHAIILHSMRDPVDTCLSSFRLLFGKRNETSYDLAAIGRQYVRYREMVAHWDRVLPGRIVHVEHETLLANPEAEIRKVVAAADLSWNDACLRFNENERTVRTASVTQVRRPLTTAAVQRWRKYERHLTPLLEALGPYAPKRL